LGSLVKTIESSVYNSPYLIKHVPWHDRPAFMREKFSKWQRIITCDFSSYEASIKFWLTRIEKIVYSHVLCPEIAEFICSCLYETNSMDFAWFRLSMDACRASGDTTTAIGNALITLFIWMFVLSECSIEAYDLVVEGDDNVAGDDGSMPIDESLFTQLGLITKIEYPLNYNTASFCGMIFSDVNDDIITDPIKVLNRFGWLDSKFRFSNLKTSLELYRGKALCNIYQYRHCPIIDSFCRAVLRVTRRYTNKSRINDKHHLNVDYVPTSETRLHTRLPPNPESRIIMEELFGVPDFIQKYYEDFFDSQTDLFMIPNFDSFRDVQSVSWNQLVKYAPVLSYPKLRHPFSTYIEFVNFCSLTNSIILSLEDLSLSLEGVHMSFMPVPSSQPNLTFI
jgi:hypothetical protein